MRLGRTSCRFTSSQHTEQGYGHRGQGVGKFGWEGEELGQEPSMEQKSTGWVCMEGPGKAAPSQVPTMGQGSYRALEGARIHHHRKFFCFVLFF